MFIACILGIVGTRKGTSFTYLYSMHLESEIILEVRGIISMMLAECLNSNSTPLVISLKLHLSPKNSNVWHGVDPNRLKKVCTLEGYLL